MISEMATREELVIAAKAGDDEAFMSLVEIETPEAYRLSLAILRQRHDAEDALQEAFVRAWDRLPELRDAERWSAWLRRIVVSNAIDAGRRKKARRLVPLGFHEPSPAGDQAVEIADRDEVGRAMSRLNEKDRALLALRFGHDLELPDVAAALGIPLGTAKSRLHRALARMRKELESSDGPNGCRATAAEEAGARIEPAPTDPGI
jgi:RNA polymerase sigma factor (sigma-70 family)